MSYRITELEDTVSALKQIIEDMAINIEMNLPNSQAGTIVDGGLRSLQELINGNRQQILQRRAPLSDLSLSLNHQPLSYEEMQILLEPIMSQLNYKNLDVRMDGYGRAETVKRSLNGDVEIATRYLPQTAIGDMGDSRQLTLAIDPKVGLNPYRYQLFYRAVIDGEIIDATFPIGALDRRSFIGWLYTTRAFGTINVSHLVPYLRDESDFSTVTSLINDRHNWKKLDWDIDIDVVDTIVIRVDGLTMTCRLPPPTHNDSGSIEMWQESISHVGVMSTSNILVFVMGSHPSNKNSYREIMEQWSLVDIQRFWSTFDVLRDILTNEDAQSILDQHRRDGHIMEIVTGPSNAVE